MYRLGFKKINTIRKENNVLRKKVRELKLKLPFEFICLKQFIQLTVFYILPDDLLNSADKSFQEAVGYYIFLFLL